MSLVALYKAMESILNFLTINYSDWVNNPTEPVTRYDDLVGAVTGVKLHDTRGTVGFNFDEIALYFEPDGSITKDNDCIFLNLQKAHSVKIASTLNMHLHYFKEDLIERTFTLKYRLLANGVAPTEWVTIEAITKPEYDDVVGDKAPYDNTGRIAQIVRFAPIDWSAYGISSTIQFRMTRTDTNTGNVNVTFIDGHVEMDSNGSKEEYVK